MQSKAAEEAAGGAKPLPELPQPRPPAPTSQQLSLLAMELIDGYDVNTLDADEL